MAIGKISGPMLQTNLERQGVDLSIDGNVAYFDVTNRRLGVNTTAPTQTLDIRGNARLANISVLGNTITSDTGVINLGNISNVALFGGSNNYVISTNGNGVLRWAQISDLDFTFGDLAFVGSTVQVTATNANLVLAANGSGVISANNTRITNVASPIADSDAVNMGWVNNTLSNFNDDRIVSGNTSVVATASNVVTTINGTVKSFADNNTIKIDGVYVTGNTITSASSSLYIGGSTIANKVVINSNSSVTLPVGDTASRPAAASAGDLRYNSSLSTVEFYSGTNWFSTTASVDSQVITPDGSSVTYSLSKPATSYSVLVSINGTLQQPVTAYTVSGSQITFAEVPLTTDVIEVRYIALMTAPTINLNTIDTSNVSVSAGSTIIDTFYANTYRSAKYTVQVSTTSGFQFDDVLVVHNGTSANVVTTTARTGSSLGTYTAQISTGAVNLIFTASNSSTLRLQTTRFLI